MALTESQLQARQHHIGSSDMAAILGVSPYSNAYEVWAAKRGIIDPIEENDAIRIGNLLEPAVREYAATELGAIEPNVYMELPEYHIGANIDGIVTKDGTPVEIKTAGMTGPLLGDWGAEGTDEVPDSYIVQCHVHMLCSGKDLCHLAAFLGGIGLRLYVVRLNDKLASVICDTAKLFWESFVERGVQPPDVRPTLEVLKRVRRQPGKIAHVHPDIIAAYQSACAAVKEAEEAKAIAQADLIASGGDAEAFDFGDAKKWYSYFEQSRSTFDAKALRADHPDLWKQYSGSSTYRTLRLVNKP